MNTMNFDFINNFCILNFLFYKIVNNKNSFQSKSQGLIYKVINLLHYKL
jgi:hypothetical protein